MSHLRRKLADIFFCCYFTFTCFKFTKFLDFHITYPHIQQIFDKNTVDYDGTQQFDTKETVFFLCLFEPKINIENAQRWSFRPTEHTLVTMQLWIGNRHLAKNNQSMLLINLFYQGYKIRVMHDK